MKKTNLRYITIFIIVLTCVVIIMSSGCDNKHEYIFPENLLAFLNETPQQVVDGVNTAKDYFPENEYGRVFINENGNLCYLLNENQRLNWYKRGKQNIDAIAQEFEQQGKTFEYLEDMQTLKLMLSEEDILDPNIEQSIDYYVGGLLNTQFFLTKDKELKLTVTIVNQENKVMGGAEWPEIQGYFK